jgi:hypothetical protein
MRHNVKHNLQVPLLLALAFSVSGCSSWLLSSTAKDAFERQQSCPRGRIKISSVAVQPRDVFEMPAPPAEVAADPGRLKVWTRNLNDDLKDHGDLTFFDAVGCGAHLNYFCWMEPNGDEWTSTCDPVDLNNPRTRIGSFRLKESALQALRERLQARD